MSDSRDRVSTPKRSPRGIRENMTPAPPPEPDATIRYFKLDCADGTLGTLFREVWYPDPLERPGSIQELDPFGRWLYNDRLRHYLKNGEADEITAHESSRLAKTHFSESLR